MLPQLDSVLEESQRKAMQDHPVPAFGRTRCYWSLLDAELRYLYLDPTCYIHMGEQAPALIGTCLLDYVHPDEQHSARADLRNVLDSRTLHGSVTRYVDATLVPQSERANSRPYVWSLSSFSPYDPPCSVRYARLSRIRTILGCAAPEPFPDAHIVTEDEHYIACDVVINWVSDNVVLCFLHAIIGTNTSPATLSPSNTSGTMRETTPDKGKADNDELHKTEWTNWCGTSAMTTDHAAELYDRLQNLVPPSHGPPDRIFQILINQPARPILFSWPPEGYTAGEFGKLAHRMQIGGPDDGRSRSEDSAKTSCTRRYKATQQVADAETLKEVESIFIPHGAVIFACHKVMSSRRYSDTTHNGRSNISDMYQHSYQSRSHHQSHYLQGAHQPLVQPHYDEVRQSANDGDYHPSGVPGSPEYARSRAPASGYQRGPAEYGGSQYGAHAGMREMGYAQGGDYGQYGSYPVQQRNGNYPPQHDSRHRTEDWAFAQSPATNSQPPPAQQWPASSKSSTSHTNGPGYDGQSWMMAQGWNPGPVEQTQNQQQLYPYQAAQSYGAPQLPPPQQPQPPPVSPPPPYPQDVPVTQPPPPPPPPPEQPVQAKRDASPQEETTTIPRVHAPPKRKRDTEGKKDLGDKDGLVRLSPPGKDMIARERGQSAGVMTRVGGGPPPGVMRCSSCKSETSPEWRKGPSGKKDLCNACGLRYARSKQKKDGTGATKRRRDKEIPLAPAPTPPSAPRHIASLPSISSAASGSSANGAAPKWPDVGSGGRDPKRARSGTMTTVSHSPSPPRSEALGQPEHYPNAYDSQYGQPLYQNGYQNGYDEYGRVGGSAPSYMPPQGRGQAPAFAG
ncbi:hypothetical protein FRC06_009991 [Ceratobasidium sp. 370]|nr:hypothetical protein FRC06_009991 [Ceratobasidium sp. 370]